MSHAVAVGVDIGGTRLRAATLDRHGGILARRTTDTPARDDARLVETICSVLDELDAATLPVGVGIAGLVTADGVVRYGPNIGIRDLPLAATLASRRPAGVVVVNDASAAAFAEQRCGAGQGVDDLLLFTLGTGIGGGVVVAGRLLLGHGGFAGEVGHVLVEEGGRTCPCSNRGCIEAYASGTAIGAIARERLVDHTVESSLRAAADPAGRDVSAAAADGDAFAQELLAEAGRWLGVAAASLVNTLDPQLVLIGGGASVPTAPWMLPAARTSLAAHLVGSRWRQAPPIELASLGDDAGVVGAAALAAARDRRPEGAP